MTAIAACFEQAPPSYVKSPEERLEAALSANRHWAPVEASFAREFAACEAPPAATVFPEVANVWWSEVYGWRLNDLLYAHPLLAGAGRPVVLSVDANPSAEPALYWATTIEATVIVCDGEPMIGAVVIQDSLAEYGPAVEALKTHEEMIDEMARRVDEAGLVPATDWDFVSTDCRNDCWGTLPALADAGP